MHIVADIGGTKTVVTLAAMEEGQVSLSSAQRFRNEDHGAFEAVLAAYLNTVPDENIDGLGISVAGVVTDNRCHMTNLDWVVDGGELSNRFDVKKVYLHNDLAAAGYGLEVIPIEGLESIGDRDSSKIGNRVLISPGTGLGECIVHAVDGRYIPMASEGGHADFAPFDGTTGRLWEFLKQKQARVSSEDLLSGPGLNNIYRFLASEDGVGLDDETERKMDDRPGVMVTDRAVDDRDPLCVRTVEMFFDILAAEGGNMVLKSLATAGAYFGGGIVPRLLPLLDKSRFAAVFADKGKHQELLETVPLWVVIDTDLPLYGAAFHLLEVASE
jgi:glucokinase